MRGRDPKMKAVIFSILILEDAHQWLYMLLVTPFKPGTIWTGTERGCSYREAGTVGR